MKIPFLKVNNKDLLLKSIIDLQNIRKRSDILVICATPTGYSWMGVNVATKSLFPNCTFEIPQYYSNSIFNDKELIELSNAIIDLKFEQLIFSGFAPFYEKILFVLHSKTIMKIIYHGFLAELSENKIQQKSFNQMIQLAKDGKIKAIGFVKKGLALSLNKLYKIPTCEIILPNHFIAAQPPQITNDINIGCLVNTTFRKNIHNQVMAALMIENAIVHVFENSDLLYLPQERLIKHRLMDHDDFIVLLGKMSLNLHVTFSESWGQVLSESISQGVPCISAYTSSFFDYDDILKQKLVVNGFDDSWFISQKINEVMADYDAISLNCIEYAHKLNMLSTDRLNAFLYD